VHVRDKRYRKFRKTISKQTALAFTDTMAKKGHAGEVKLNHETGSMNFEVAVNSLTRKGETNAASAGELSGGERSYTLMVRCMFHVRRLYAWLLTVLCYSR